MQYGIFSDIHGNLTALKAVWNVFESAGLSERTLLNAGDNVGYGSDPEACLEFLCARPSIMTVKGNYDKNVALFPEREGEYRRKWGRSRPEKFEALRQDSSMISETSRHWLHDLPTEAELTLESVPVFLTHYAPGSKEGLGVWTPSARLAELAANTTAKVVICGHTHSPFVRQSGGILWINPGSLGRSWDGKYRFATLTLEPGLPPSAELKSVR